MGFAAGKNRIHFMAVFAYESTGRLFLCRAVSANSLVKLWHSQCSSFSGQVQQPARTQETEFLFLALQQTELNTTSADCSQKPAHSTFLPLLCVRCDFKCSELGATSRSTTMLHYSGRVWRETARLSSASNVKQLHWDSVKSHTLLGAVEPEGQRASTDN